MRSLVDTIRSVQSKAESWKRRGLNEASTKAALIEPMLEALGWDTRDPAEVAREAHTPDGKLVDYALKVDDKDLCFIEAKPLGEPLDDNKAIGQVVAYANTAGVEWAVLTDGLRWRVYKARERGPAADKLMFELHLDPNEGASVEQLAERLSRLSRDAISRGVLDQLGVEIFTDSRTRKALDLVLQNAPLAVVRLVRREVADPALTASDIRQSIQRVWAQFTTASSGVESAKVMQTRSEATSLPPRRSGRRGQRPKAAYPETLHTSNKPREVLELYRRLEQCCSQFAPGAVSKEIQKKTVSYRIGPRAFCSVWIGQGGLRIWLPLKLSRVNNPPPFARDVSDVGHWGSGDLELRITSATELELAEPMIRAAFDAVSASLPVRTQ